MSTRRQRWEHPAPRWRRGDQEADRLPILASVPHAGWRVPAEARAYCVLDEQDILADSDVQAQEIYALEDRVEAYATTDVARAIVDLNRPPDDRSADGAVKTHTCWGVPVYRPPPPDEVALLLIRRHHEPYHRRLAELAARPGVLVGVDLHTMADIAPPAAPVPGCRRPEVCLSDRDGATMPRHWMEGLTDAFRATFGVEPSINTPFKGGYITRRHGRDHPWVQVELSRGDWATVEGKHEGVLQALEQWCRTTLPMVEAEVR